MRSPSVLASLALALASTAALDAPAFAQAAPRAEPIVVGEWTFHPSLEVRLRGEYRTHPIDLGGVIHRDAAVLAEGDDTGAPVASVTTSAVDDAWGVGARSRLGLAVDRGPVTAALTLQDARMAGTTEGARLRAAGEPALPSFGPYEAYIDVHARKGRRSFARLGRQRVVWGEGRLLGASDWSLTPRSLDAMRAGVAIGDVDLELLAALLAAPGAITQVGDASDAAALRSTSGSGAQLYGMNALWHLVPLLQVELTALARVVRDPAPTTLATGDTFVGDLRLAGEQRGFRYSVEGAYELGRIATTHRPRDLAAFALAARASLETSLPWHLTFGAEGAYASGDEGPLAPGDTQRRFDPILPDEHTSLGPMGLYGWSNVIEAGGRVATRPADDVTATLAYRFAALAEPGGRWTSARLVPIGGPPTNLVGAQTNDARSLGHELDATLGATPFDALHLEAGYGLFLFGDGAKNVLAAAGRGRPDLQHWAYLQATVTAP